MLLRRISLALSIALLTVVAVRAEDQKPLHSAIKPVPRDANWMKRHESFNEKAKKGDINLVFIGDSITQGWEGAGKEVWAKYYTPRHTLNLGIGGDRTEHVLWRLDNGNIEGIHPKLAVIMIGTNNSNSNKPEEIAEGIQLIVKKLQTKLPETKILLLAIFPRGADDNDPKRKINKATNEIIAKLADGKKVYFLDIGPKFVGTDGTLSKEVMPDLLHLNGKSYQTWAESIEPKVKELLGEK